MMRIPIREQLALLILLSALIGLAVISIATWISNHEFVLSICSSRLALTASLKAAQLASNLDLMQTTASFLTTRIIIQFALQRYNQMGNDTKANWLFAVPDMAAAIGNGGSVGQALLLQSMILPKNGSGPGGKFGLLNTTNPAIIGKIHLPYICPNGSKATLGMNASECGGMAYGYPPALYPNLTYIQSNSPDPTVEESAQYKDVILGPGGQAALMIGPWKINSSFSLVSITLPILNNTNRVNVLGYMTAVMDARLISQVLDSTEGLENTGETLLVGPATTTNIFPKGITYETNHGYPPGDFLVQYVVPLNASSSSRHPNKTIGTKNAPWEASEYPAVELAFTQSTGEQDNSGATVKGHNEAGVKVASGYATPQSELVNWVVVVEQSRGEVWAPINHLRDILLACVFGTAGLMAIIAFPLAHFASLPIRRLREATAKSVEPPGLDQSRSSIGSFESMAERHGDGTEDVEAADGAVLARKEGFNPVRNWRQKRHHEKESRRDRRRKREIRIPAKVKERKHIVKDELSDLTTTFNEMSDELMMQYTKLEERVQQRTAELEQSKKAAEAANESKTLFIANISHELKTPLNGILGMCAVCMQEDDPIRLKRSLGIIYKSGDLLLNLLTDLLTFSKNQVGQHLSLDEKEFRLRDVSSQILAIFDKQAKEGHIDLRVEWEGVQYLPQENSSPERTDYGPNGTGRLKDMILWGDLQRILQVVINLVSNSLKFTPSGGAVVLTIRCLPDTFETASRKASSSSKQSRQSRQVSQRKGASDSMLSGTQMSTANAINAKDKPHALAQIYTSDRASSPPPGVFLYFEFEVKDTGPGIPDDLQAKIFEPFVQGDLGLSKKFGGTGLGLSICSQLATLMRGTVGVQSTLGVGSTFSMKIPLRHLKTRADSSASSSVDLPADVAGPHRGVTLDDGDYWAPARHSRHLATESDEKASINTGPASTPTLGSDSQPRLVGLSQPFFAASQPLESPGSQPAAMEKIAADATRSGGKIRVLVAEDNKVNQEVVLRMLKLEDIYDVTVAKDGQEALDFVKASMKAAASSDSGEEHKPYNLIFMDVQMPNVDGLQSTRLIREIGYQVRT
jgi:osomolarity two-component system sensor histidine kinase SLN1